MPTALGQDLPGRECPCGRAPCQADLVGGGGLATSPRPCPCVADRLPRDAETALGAPLVGHRCLDRRSSPTSASGSGSRPSDEGSPTPSLQDALGYKVTQLARELLKASTTEHYQLGLNYDSLGPLSAQNYSYRLIISNVRAVAALPFCLDPINDMPRYLPPPLGTTLMSFP